MTSPNPSRLVGDVGQWSAEKLQLLRCYLGGDNNKGGFLPATQRARERYYIDLFAGSGQNRIRHTSDIIDGSPLISVKAGPPVFTRLYWVDAEERNVASLDAHRLDHPNRQITTIVGDANVRVDDILRTLPKTFPTFAFLDPRGGELRWDTVAKLSRHKPSNKIELFILFAYNQGLVRLMPHDPNRMVHQDVLDRVMPDAASWRRIYATRVNKQATRHDFRRAMLDEYVRGLTALGYAFVPSPRLIRAPNNRPLYFMIFASDHRAGDKIMTWCLENVESARKQRSLFGYQDEY